MVCDHPPIPLKIVAPKSAKAFANLKRPYASVIALVDEHGGVTAAWIDLSSGNKAYDSAAVTAIKLWSFVPAAAGCKDLPGESEWVVGGNDASFPDACNHGPIVTLEAKPQLPMMAIQANDPLATDVTISLDEFGEVKHAALKHGSGSKAADDAVMKAALASNYFPAVRNCLPQPSEYTFTEGITP